jgi:hypothetical protein
MRSIDTMRGPTCMTGVASTGIGFIKCVEDKTQRRKTRPFFRHTFNRHDCIQFRSAVTCINMTMKGRDGIVHDAPTSHL